MTERDYQILEAMFLQLGGCIEGLVSQNPRLLEDYHDGAAVLLLDAHGVQVLHQEDNELTVPDEWGTA